MSTISQLTPAQRHIFNAKVGSISGPNQQEFQFASPFLDSHSGSPSPHFQRLVYAAIALVPLSLVSKSESIIMKAYAILDIDIHDPAGYSKYPPLVWPLIEKHSGKITHRISDFEIVEGDWCPKRVLIVEFPDKRTAKAFLDDPEYQPIKDIRLGAATSLMVIGNSEI